ncbi:MAG: helix-turn-helix domain-containing protein, partial [Culicoidibacterales bacterium]
MLQLHENLVKLRKIRGITQAQLAAFIGVTKASVSKWETGQSLPDILLLPQLAAYYAVSVDELLGYEPQLNKQ